MRSAYVLLFASVILSDDVTANPFAPQSLSNSNTNVENNYVNNLIRGSQPTSNSQIRQLSHDDGQAFEVDLSNYAVKFQQCQSIKTYDDELASENSDSVIADSIMATKRFVIFRLCPKNGKSKSCPGSCDHEFGEYLIDLETYLGFTADYQHELQEDLCSTCKDDLEEDNACFDMCQKIENMEEYGYLDATVFIRCSMIWDSEDDQSGALYAGPVCANEGSKIKIGVFRDEYCYNQDASKDVDQYIMNAEGYNMKLSHVLLKKTYDKDDCIPCWAAVGDNVESAQVCRRLHESSAKCEHINEFRAEHSSQDRNQAATEPKVCDFMESLKNGDHEETGTIFITSKDVTTGTSYYFSDEQKFGLIFLIGGCLGLAIYAITLHNKLQEQDSSVVTDKDGDLQVEVTKLNANDDDE